jgi:hypothetical protein
MKESTADLWFSRFIRLRDSDENGYCKCITCNTVLYWKSMDNGHYVKRQHQGARFHEKNCHAQCKVCNWQEQGRNDVYKQVIIERYGQQEHDLLKFAERHTTKHSCLEIKLIAKEYQKKAKDLAKNKGLII